MEKVKTMTKKEFKALLKAHPELSALGFTLPQGAGGKSDAEGLAEHKTFRAILERDGLAQVRLVCHFLNQNKDWFKPGARLNTRTSVCRLVSLIETWLRFNTSEAFLGDCVTEGACALALFHCGFHCQVDKSGWPGLGMWSNVATESIKYLRFSLIMQDKSLNLPDRLCAIGQVWEPPSAHWKDRQWLQARDREKSTTAAPGGTEAGGALENSPARLRKAGSI